VAVSLLSVHRRCERLEGGLSDVFDIDLLNRCVKQARSLRPLMRSAVSDDGREFYFMVGPTRNDMIQSIECGWSFRTVTFGSGRFSLLERFRIDADKVSASGTGYFDSGYIA